jgi:hypothetical protein
LPVDNPINMRYTAAGRNLFDFKQNVLQIMTTYVDTRFFKKKCPKVSSTHDVHAAHLLIVVHDLPCVGPCEWPMRELRETGNVAWKQINTLGSSHSAAPPWFSPLGRVQLDAAIGTTVR